jgi:hypothetical protein
MPTGLKASADFAEVELTTCQLLFIRLVVGQHRREACATFSSKCHRQRRQTPLIFPGRADGDANPFRQLVAAHRAHNHTLLLHRFENFPAVTDADQYEIGRRGNEFELQAAERLLEKFQPGKIVPARPADMLRIVQRSERGGLRQQIDIERLPDFFQRGNEAGVPDAVADAQAGQAVNF